MVSNISPIASYQGRVTCLRVRGTQATIGIEIIVTRPPGDRTKPAVVAETDDYVAFGSEYRALAGLPGIDKAKVWEPEPATVYFWQR